MKEIVDMQWMPERVAMVSLNTTEMCPQTVASAIDTDGTPIMCQVDG